MFSLLSGLILVFDWICFDFVVELLVVSCVLVCVLVLFAFGFLIECLLYCLTDVFGLLMMMFFVCG